MITENRTIEYHIALYENTVYKGPFKKYVTQGRMTYGEENDKKVV